MTTDVKLEWKGPFRPGKSGENELPPEKTPGVYIWAVSTPSGRLLAYVGKAGDIRSRWSVHVYWLLGGGYHLYNVGDLRRGEGLRREYDFGKKDEFGNMTTVFAEFVKRFKNLAPIAKENLESYELYWAPVIGHDALRCSVESAIFYEIFHQKEIGAVAGKLLQNERPSRLPKNAIKVRCLSTWPNGVTIEGLFNELRFGERELGEGL